MDKKLNEAVAALRPQMVAALQRLVRRRSVEADPLPGKPFGEEVDACFAEALTLCHELGFETTDMDRYIGWCEIGTGDEMVAVLGHLDVVPEGEGWHHPPYAAEIEDRDAAAAFSPRTKAPTGTPHPSALAHVITSGCTP